jgi:hypothetical protein
MYSVVRFYPRFPISTLHMNLRPLSVSFLPQAAERAAQSPCLDTYDQRQMERLDTAEAAATLACGPAVMNYYRWRTAAAAIAP